MSQRRAFKQNKADIRSRLKKEWVSLEDGDVCVWELTTAEASFLAERSRRPSIDTRGGMDQTMATAWLISLSVHHGDEADSPRVWDDITYQDALLLRARDANKITEAFSRVNGTSDEALEAASDFFGAAEEPKPSASIASASNNSTGSLARSKSPIAS